MLNITKIHQYKINISQYRVNKTYDKNSNRKMMYWVSYPDCLWQKKKVLKFSVIGGTINSWLLRLYNMYLLIIDNKLYSKVKINICCIISIYLLTMRTLIAPVKF